MSQGKEWNQKEVIEALKPYFKLGCSVNKACKYAGIAQSTVQTWIDNSEELRLQIGAWQSELNEKARKIWADELEKGNFDAALKLLERIEKDEYTTRSELTGKDGKDLIPSAEELEQANKSLLGMND